MRGRRMDNGRYTKAYSDILTKEFLEEEYSNKKRSTYMIAEDVGCSPKLIYNYLDYYKIPRINMWGIIQPNQQFGWLTTIKVVEKRKNGALKWLCKCRCGKEVYQLTADLKKKNKTNRAKSCGCYRKTHRNSKWNGYCDISGTLISDLKHRSKKKKMDMDIDAKFLWDLFIKQDKKCAISGLDIKINKTASVDRIDSLKGYTKNNIWWVHRDVNKIKMDLPLSRLIELCEIITIKQKGGVI